MIALSPKAMLAGGAAIALLASHGCGYVKGRGAGAASVEAKYASAVAKAARAMAKAQTRIDAIGAAGANAAAAQDQESRSIIHETLRIIERPVYRNLCVDADGVGLLDRAAANANRTPDFVQPAD
ncbi:hypothetical protein [Rhizorhabdus histidinilytica]|uniref:hypothetical protein n=1 Tax=Rhizorhabdus histidinilytica TaxID=439228 RepID=UPI00321FD5C1